MPVGVHHTTGDGVTLSHHFPGGNLDDPLVAGLFLFQPPDRVCIFQSSFTFSLAVSRVEEVVLELRYGLEYLILGGPQRPQPVNLRLQTDVANAVQHLGQPHVLIIL